MKKLLTQDMLFSNLEAIINTLASMLIFIGFGLPVGVVLGMTLSIYLKNIGVRRLFVYITKKRKGPKDD